MFYEISFGICFALLFAAIVIIFCREQDRMVERARYNHIQDYNKKLCSRLDEIEKENNELYSQNYKLENENKQLDFYIKMLELDMKNKQNDSLICPVCGYKVKENDNTRTV